MVMLGALTARPPTPPTFGASIRADRSVAVSVTSTDRRVTPTSGAPFSRRLVGGALLVEITGASIFVITRNYKRVPAFGFDFE